MKANKVRVDYIEDDGTEDYEVFELSDPVDVKEVQFYLEEED